MAELPPQHLEKYLADFEKHFAGVDELDMVVLKGHLLIEAALDNVITAIFFHPEYISNGRFGFGQKVQIGRGYCFRKDKLPMWNVMLAVNNIRNEIAHNLEGSKKQNKLNQLRRLLIADENNKTIAHAFEVIDDSDIIRLACQLCVGFLAAFELDLQSLRKMHDAVTDSQAETAEMIQPSKPVSNAKK